MASIPIHNETEYTLIRNDAANHPRAQEHLGRSQLDPGAVGSERHAFNARPREGALRFFPK